MSDFWIVSLAVALCVSTVIGVVTERSSVEKFVLILLFCVGETLLWLVSVAR